MVHAIVEQIKRERYKNEEEFSWDNVELENTNKKSFKRRNMNDPVLENLKKTDNETYKKYKMLADNVQEWSHIKTGYFNGDNIEVTNPRFEGKYIILDSGLKGNFYSNPKREHRLYLEKILKEWEELQEPFEVEILTADLNNYNFEVSITAKFQKHLETQLREEYMNNIPVTGKILEYTPAGYNVEIDFFSGKYPAYMPTKIADVNKILNPHDLVGEEMELIITEYNKERGTYLVSRQAYLETLIPDKIKELEYDTEYEGHVTGFSKDRHTKEREGIFIQFEGCLTGKAYESEWSKETKENIKSLKPGDPIKFYIKSIGKDDDGRPKIGLTQIDLEGIWKSMEIDQDVKGKIKSIKDFGVFISLSNGMTGLIHKVELDKFIKFENEQGDNIFVKIIELNNEKKQVNLSLSEKSGFKKKPEVIEQEKKEAKEAEELAKAQEKDEDKE